MAWPTTTETTEQTYTTEPNGNEYAVTQTVWPAAIITLTSEPPEPPGPGRS